jgi:hypothetical protein
MPQPRKLSGDRSCVEEHRKTNQLAYYYPLGNETMNADSHLLTNHVFLVQDGIWLLLAHHRIRLSFGLGWPVGSGVLQHFQKEVFNETKRRTPSH